MNFIDLDDEVKQKKRIIKYLIDSAQGDRGLALTKPEAENVNSLLDACENIETQATIVLKSLDQSILKDSYSGQESLNRFYTVLRQGLKTLTKTTFRQLPKTDVQNLNDYKDSLEELYEKLNERFDDLQDILYGNEPIKGRTKAQYEAETGKPYMPPVPLEKIEKIRKGKREKGKTKITKHKSQKQEYTQNLQSLQEDYERMALVKQDYEDKLQGIDNELDVVTELMKAATGTFNNREKMFINNTKELHALDDELTRTGNTDYLRVNDLKRMITSSNNELAALAKRKKALQTEFLGLTKLKRELPNIINAAKEEIDKIYEDMEMTHEAALALEGVIQTAEENLPEDMTQEEKDLYLEKEPMATKLSGKDYEFIMKDFNIFIKSLSDGLIRYTAGLSTKLSKSQETNFRTPVDSAVAKLEVEGAGYIGGGVIKHGELIHRRFL